MLACGIRNALVELFLLAAKIKRDKKLSMQQISSSFYKHRPYLQSFLDIRSISLENHLDITQGQSHLSPNSLLKSNMANIRFLIVNRDSAPRRARRWGVQSDVGELDSEKSFGNWKSSSVVGTGASGWISMKDKDFQI